MSEEKREEISETKNASFESDSETEASGAPSSFNAKKWTVIGASVAGLLILLAIVYFAWWRNGSKTAEMAATEIEKNETGTVKFLMEQQWLVRMKLALAEEQTVSSQITSIGRVVPAANSQAIVSTPVAGILSEKQLPRMGQFVSGGQPVAVVRQTATATEQAQTRAAIAQVEAQKAQVEAQRVQVEAQKSQIAIENARLETEKRAAAGEVETTRVRLETARREADRAQRLYDGRAASLKQLQAAQSELKTAQAAFDSAVRRRDALNSARPIAPPKINIDTNFGGGLNNVSSSFTVAAPFGGYVTKVNKSIGEQVSPGDAIVEISSLDTVYVEAPIFERDLNALGGSRTATFTVSAYPQDFKGTVLDIGATIDEQTRAANVIFQVENAGRALRLGMQANVRLDAEQTVTAMMIPREAVLEHEGKKIVY